jgi:hypothetical protein
MCQVLRERLEAAKRMCAIKEYNIKKVGASPPRGSWEKQPNQRTYLTR